MKTHRPMSPLASDLFAMLGDALRPDPALDSLARVDAALCIATHGTRHSLPSEEAMLERAAKLGLSINHYGSGQVEFTGQNGTTRWRAMRSQGHWTLQQMPRKPAANGTFGASA